MDKPEQWASDLVEQVIPAWWKDSDGVDGAWDSPAAAAIIQRAFEEQTRPLRDALEWYAEQARLCRLIHSEGDAGRHELSADGGKRALAALKDKP